MLLEEGNFASVYEVHSAVVEQHDHDVDEDNGEDVEVDVCIERRVPGISPWM